MPLAILLSVMLVGLAVSHWSLSLPRACAPVILVVRVLLGDYLSLGRFWVWIVVEQPWYTDGEQKCSDSGSPTVPVPCVFLAGLLFGQSVERKWSLTSVLRRESASVRPALFAQVSGPEGHGIAPGLCVDGDKEGPQVFQEAEIIIHVSFSFFALGDSCLFNCKNKQTNKEKQNETK